MKIVSIVLPTFNEEANLENTVAEVLAQEKETAGWQYQLIIADSSSTDGTLEIAKKLAKKNSQVRVLSVGPGLGVALVEAHQYALKNLHPDALAQLDADGQVGADVLQRLLQGIDEGYDLVIGSRFVSGGKNMLSPSRRIFTAGSSFFCRIMMGPFNIKEFTNSARAFTPQLFQKINLHRLPWREKTFIYMPAFINEAVLSGAKYKEVPLLFKNRAEGYSKNKVVNYTYDIITYCIDARLHKWGFNVDFFKVTRKAKTLIKFGLVGFSGTLVDFIFYNIFISFLMMTPAMSKGFSTEVAIINNFILNHIWTFKHRKNNTKIWWKFVVFNFVSFGGLAIAVVIVKYLHIVYGDGFIKFLGLNIPYYNLYFFITIPPVMTWNFVMNHFVTWRHSRD